jgi:hypothetical protein
MKGITPPLRYDDTAEEPVKLFVVANRELQMARNNPAKETCNVSTAANIHLPSRNSDSPLLLIVPRSIPCELKDLSGEILEDSGEVHRCAGTDSFGVLTVLQKTVQASHRELESCAGGTGLGFGRVAIASALTGGAGLACFSSFSFSGLCTSTSTIRKKERKPPSSYCLGWQRRFRGSRERASKHGGKQE